MARIAWTTPIWSSEPISSRTFRIFIDDSNRGSPDCGLRAIIRTRAEVIYSSAPYFTSHLTGYSLARLTGLPWVAHFRDPWITGLHAERRPGKICFKINRALERMTVSRADAVVCVTEEHAAVMRAAYDQMPASKFAVVMNGFDGLEWQEVIESLTQSAPGAP